MLSGDIGDSTWQTARSAWLRMGATSENMGSKSQPSPAAAVLATRPWMSRSPVAAMVKDLGPLGSELAVGSGSTGAGSSLVPSPLPGSSSSPPGSSSGSSSGSAGASMALSPAGSSPVRAARISAPRSRPAATTMAQNNIHPALRSAGLVRTRPPRIPPPRIGGSSLPGPVRRALTGSRGRAEWGVSRGSQGRAE